MKALTLTQPWASLIAIGAKRIETRSWKTEYRGPVAIHAARATTPNVHDLAITNHPAFVDKLAGAGYDRATFMGRPGPWRVPHGAILAVVDVADCVRVETLEAEPISVYEHAFGDYQPGRYAWKLENVRSLKRPVQARGFQHLWTPDPATLAQVEAQLR